MFYGNFAEGRGEAFKACLANFRQIFGRLYAQDNLIALGKSAGFLDDARFRRALTAVARTEQERSLAWRLHTLTWAAEHCLSVPGDFVECGVFKGFSLAVVTAYLEWQRLDRRLYLYDTFEGIPEAYNSENRSNREYQRAMEGDKDAVFAIAAERFRPYPNVRIVRGIVPDSFAEACPGRIAFLHLDMNSSKAEIAALDVLWERLSLGALIVLDDYGWAAYASQKRAEDAWFEERRHRVLELPTGQGLVIRQAGAPAPATAASS